MRKWILLCFVVCSLLLFVYGCNTNVNPSLDQTQPITLKVYQHVSNITDADFKEFIADTVKNKFPNITMELVRDKPGQTIDQLVAAGNFPDLIFTGSNSINDFLPDQIPYDLTPLINKNHVDVSKYQPVVMDDIKMYGDKGQLYALPFSMNFSFLVYNKDIFDKFGVPYPKDGMTWEEVLNLAKQVSGTIDGTQYFGLEPTTVGKFGSPLSLPVVDPKTNQGMLESSGWQEVFNLLKTMAEQTGNVNIGGNIYDKFLHKQTYAMMVTYGDFLSNLEQEYQNGNKFNWDIVSYPSFKEKPGVGLRNVAHVLMISSASSHKEQAFQVLSYLAGPEVQSMIGKKGRLSAIQDPILRDQFGSELQSLQGKNVQAAFKAKPSPNPTPTPYDAIAQNLIESAINDVFSGKVDVNTALRQANDQLNQQIKVAQQTRK